MQPTLQVPGVYIVEQNAFPNSVVEVATAIPAFVGYTEKAMYKGKPLGGVPTRVGSLKEFEDRFGGAFKQVFDLTIASASSGGSGKTAAPTAAPAGTITGGTITAGDITGENDTTQPTNLSKVTIANADVTNAIIDNKPAVTITGATLAGVDITGATVASGKVTGGPITGGTTSWGTVSAQGGSTNSGTTGISPASAALAVPIIFDSGVQATLAPVLPQAGGSLFYLYNSLQFFFLNGGGPCYIVSVGDYTTTSAAPKDFEGAIDTLEAEQDPTMLLCPDALMLNSDSYNEVATYMLEHCAKVQRRVALFDVYGGAATATTGKPANPGQPVTMADTDSFRTAIGENNLNYGIAYFPWMNTAIVSATDLSFLNLSLTALSTLAGSSIPASTSTSTKTVADLTTILNPSPALTSASDMLKIVPDFVQAYSSLLSSPSLSAIDAAKAEGLKVALHNKLKANSPEYGQVLQAIATYLSVLPVAPAMAGVYTAIDASRGVWKAPANVSLNAVISPTVAISDDMQAGLNVDALTGKSINVIRTFKGLGTLVWGARTLDGNSQDWRYINVRRTIIMIEQSIKLAARNTVFEPNDANTWATFKSMLESFLFTLWKQGALAGATAPEAYQVQVGLGSTMTGDDVLNGIMRVSVKLALVRPAEFIVVTFQQEMQTS
jgi:phage tail sheath protein FI